VVLNLGSLELLDFDVAVSGVRRRDTSCWPNPRESRQKTRTEDTL